MNTKDLLLEAIDLLNEGNNVEAANRVETAADADVDNSFEALADKLYSDLLLDNEDVANKFKNLYSKYITAETPDAIVDEKETVIINNTTTKETSTIKWIVIGLIVILAIYLLGTILSIGTVVPTI